MYQFHRNLFLQILLLFPQVNLNKTISVIRANLKKPVGALKAYLSLAEVRGEALISKIFNIFMLVIE